MRRLFEECKYAHGNASLLSDALVHARPEDLKNKAILKVSPFLDLTIRFLKQGSFSIK